MIETQNAIHRAFRRSHIPVAYTQGFSPQIRMVMPPPLPTGVAGLREKAVVFLDAPFDAQMKEALCNCMAPLLPMVDLRKMDDSEGVAFERAVFRVEKTLITESNDDLAEILHEGERAIEFQLKEANGNHPSLRKTLERMGCVRKNIPAPGRAKTPPESLSGVVRVELFLRDEKNV